MVRPSCRAAVAGSVTRCARGCSDDRILLLSVNDDVLFFNSFDGPWWPTLRLLHRYPTALPQQQVDKGAIKHLLSGADVMAPGLTSPGARLQPLPKGARVAVMCEGMEHAIGVGTMLMSSDEIAATGHGVAIEMHHILNDGLWAFPKLTTLH